MKKQFIKNSLLAIFLCAAMSQAQASCLEENWISLREAVTSISPCQLTDNLTLEPIQMAYQTEYWRGSYSRNVTKNHLYLHEILDGCGWHHRVVFTQQVNRTENTLVHFTVDNPNLHNDVQASYDLAPMTPEEAHKAFQKVHRECLNYHP